MTDRLIDSHTGELVVADDAWERHIRIIGLRNATMENCLQLGKELYWLEKEKQHKALGYSTFDAYIASPDVDVGRRMAFGLKAVYAHFVLGLESATVALLAAGTSKLELLIPHTNEENADEWIFKAQALSRSDLRREIKEHFGNDGMGVHYSSESSEWYTPQHIIDRVLQVMGAIDLDPCSDSHDMPNVPAKMLLTKEDDALSQEWHGRIYMNPPYGREIGSWIEHLCQQYWECNIIEAVALIPARTDTAWFKKLRTFPRCFLWGRLRFSGHKTAAPFPSAVVYLGTHLNSFVAEFADVGDVYRLIDSAAT